MGETFRNQIDIAVGAVEPQQSLKQIHRQNEHFSSRTVNTAKTVFITPRKLVVEKDILSFGLSTSIDSREEISSDRCLIQKISFIAYIKIHMIVPFGKAVYVVGSCQDLGNWNVSESVRLEWTQGHLWRGSCVIRTSDDFEYKYVVANYTNPCASRVEWECGSNRKVDITEVQHGQIYLNQRWNYEKVTLEIVTSQADEMSVIGNAIELGMWSSKRFLRRQNTKDPEKQLWAISFYIERHKQYLHYYYIKKSKGVSVREREPGRYLKLGESTMQPSNFDNRLSIVRKPGELEVTDIDIFEQFKISEITSELFVGPYVKHEKEIKELAKHNIKAVLSLQTKHDMTRYGIEWDALKQVYAKHGITAVNVEIIDRKNSDFVRKCRKALKTLTNLVDKHGKVYLHCTAGLYRSPQLALVYLATVKGETLLSALECLRQGRPFVRPVLECVSECLYLLGMQKENIDFTNC